MWEKRQLSFGGDGDSCVMKCMKVFSSFHTSPLDILLSHIPKMTMFNVSLPSSNWVDCFFLPLELQYVVCKMLCMLLSYSKVICWSLKLCFQWVIFFCQWKSFTYLKTITTKRQTWLTLKDINHKDKQNSKPSILQMLDICYHMYHKRTVQNGTLQSITLFRKRNMHNSLKLHSNSA